MKRGEDQERDVRLDLIYGSIEIGPTIYKLDGGDWLMGNRIKTYGYDGSVVKDEIRYNVRLSWD